MFTRENSPMSDPGEATCLAPLSRVCSLTLARDESELPLVIRLRAEASRSETEHVFRNVSDLRFRGELTLLTELVLLLVENVSSDGWEAVRFWVKDDEEEFISFRCSEIQARPL